MNLILTRTKDEHLSFRWEPFATSTPLKTISNNVNFGNRSPNQMITNINSPAFVTSLQKSCNISHGFEKKTAESKQLVSKRTRKKKSSMYFDLSSSDDDSSGENKKRPIIKLSSGKKIKSILVSTKGIDEKLEVMEKTCKTRKTKNPKRNQNISNKKCDSVNVPNIKSLKPKPKSIHEVITLSSALSSDPNFKSIRMNSNDSKISETSRTENSEKGMFCSENKENGINHSVSDDNLRHLSEFSKTRIKGYKEILTANQISASQDKIIHKSIINDLQSLSSPHKNVSVNGESSVSNKRKGKDFVNATGLVKKMRTKKTNSKIATKLVNKLVENGEHSLHTCENKVNLTHQLFSDIKEQEFINTLDLTSDEVNEALENTECFLWQNGKKVPNKPFVSPHPSNQKSFGLNEIKQDIHNRKKPSSKGILIPKNSDELLSDTHTKKQNKTEISSKDKIKSSHQIKKFHLLTKSKEVLLEGVAEESFKKINIKDKKMQKKGKRNTANILERKKTSPVTTDVLNKKINNDKLKNTESNIKLSSIGSGAEFNENSELNRPEESQEEEQKDVHKKRSVFKLLNELPYEKNKLGCSVAQCWNINTFKCGVFKLKVKSQMTCKTLHSNSHLGGVLVKGHLRMKIGSKELDLKEGDMAFVPPLTEWQATNIGECESIFYYWCGRFNS